MLNGTRNTAPALILVTSLLVLPWTYELAQTGATDKNFDLVINVNLVNVIATVTAIDGSLVPDLTEKDFEILEDGQVQKISFFGRQADQPLQLLLLFDSSFSIAPALKTQQEAASEFVRSILRPMDRVSVLRISEDVSEIVHESHQVDRVTEAIRSIKPGGGTSLYDAIYLSTEILSGSKGRRVILIISDGTDTTSRTQFKDCLRAVLNSESVVYSLIVQPIKSEPGRNLGGEHALIYLSDRTGGRYFRVSFMGNFRESFEAISRELRTQYVLGYYPQHSMKHEYRKIDVRVNNPSYSVRARDGYFTSLR